METNERRPPRPTEAINALHDLARGQADAAIDADKARAIASRMAYLERQLRERLDVEREGAHGLRPQVLGFAWLMEHRLRAHDQVRGGQGWHGADPLQLLGRAAEQLRELLPALMEWSDPRLQGDALQLAGAQAAQIAANAANFAMMIADVCHRVDTIGPGHPEKRRKRIRQLRRMREHLERLLVRVRADGVTPNSRIAGLESDDKALEWVLRLLDPRGEIQAGARFIDSDGQVHPLSAIDRATVRKLDKFCECKPGGDECEGCRVNRERREQMVPA